MTISASAFKSRCLEILRQMERRGAPIEITRRGRVVARLLPPASPTAGKAPWDRLRGTGRLLASAEESVLSDVEFDALR